MAVVWAKQVPGQRTGRDNPDGSRTYTDVWQAKTDRPIDTAADVLRSALLPQRFDPLYVYVPNPADLVYGTYTVNFIAPFVPEVADATVRLTDREPRQTADPYHWEVALTYEGTDDPTLEPAEVLSDVVEYQEYATHDVNGRPVMNSAFDPIDGGMPRDGFFKRITVTRNLPWGQWNQKKADGYAKTLNRNPFILSGQYTATGEPERYEAGQVLLKSTSERRVVRWRGATPASAAYYWRVSAELLVDLDLVRLPDGKSQLRRHRFVVPDAGLKAFLPKPVPPPPPPPPPGLPPPPPPVTNPNLYVKRAVRSGPDVDSSPTLLDGFGRPLMRNNQEVELSFSAYTTTSLAIGGAALGPVAGIGLLGVDFYSTAMNTALVVGPADGVRKNDSPFVTSVEKVAGSEVGGTATLAEDGSFTFSPAAGFYGWAKFRYKMKGLANSPEQDVFILVGPVPVPLFFDRYPWKDWGGIAALLEGW
jgi:hypothetical protein